MEAEWLAGYVTNRLSHPTSVLYLIFTQIRTSLQRYRPQGGMSSRDLKKKITSVVVLSEFVFFLKREKLLVEEFVNKVYTSKRLISAYP